VARFDGWRHCPRCAAPLATVTAPFVRCAACGFESWANSAATANALIEDADGRVLLGRRARDPDRGLWDIVGGFLEEAEHPLDALVREVREETGLDVVPGAFLGCWTDVYGEPGARVIHTLNLFWRAALAPPAPAELAFRCVAPALDAWRRTR